MSGKPIRIGARVRTPKGVGEVLEVVKWVDRIVMMSDAEAKNFTRRLRADIGPEFKGKWKNVLVSMRGKTQWFEAPFDVEVLDD